MHATAARSRSTAWGHRAALCCLVWSAAPAPAQWHSIYVDQHATGNNTGESWANAYIDLHVALDAAQAWVLAHFPHYGYEARVYLKPGVYRPSGAADGYDRTRSFRIPGGTFLIGSVPWSAGGTPPPPENPGLVVLDGDLLGNDGPNFANYDDNSLHVVTRRSETRIAPLARIAYVDIRGGNANGAGQDGRGAGFYGWSQDGPDYDVVFDLEDCRLYANRAVDAGAAIYSRDARLTTLRCWFSGNEAPSAAAVSALRFNATDSIFTGNGVLSGGPAVVVRWWSGYFYRCSLVGNPAGAYRNLSTNQVPEDVQTSIYSSIFWNNGPTSIAGVGPFQVVTTDIEGGWPGSENIDADPRMVNPAGFDGIPGTLDDDLHLAAGSPCINASPQIAPNGSGWDYRHSARVQQCRVDLGALESPFFPDCDHSGVSDDCELQQHLSWDDNQDGVLDRCEPGYSDCNENGIRDSLEADADGDGTIDDCDNCPADARKTQPDACGCGNPDTDSDSDGAADCIDNCATVPNPDQADSNKDGTGDACEPPPPGSGIGSGDGSDGGESDSGESDNAGDESNGDTTGNSDSPANCAACGPLSLPGFALTIAACFACMSIRRRGRQQ